MAPAAKPPTDPPPSRAERKRRTHRRIVEAAARGLREEGLAGAAVQRVMEQAGLTHGGFYSHFDSKDDLVVEALVDAMEESRERLLAGRKGRTGSARLKKVVDRYLSRAHRDAAGAGCPLPSTCAEVAHAPDSVRRAFGEQLRATVEQLEAELGGSDAEQAHARVVGTLSMCVGGLMLARAVGESALSDDILRSCRQLAATTRDEEKA